jgi:hypothetical protein
MMNSTLLKTTLLACLCAGSIGASAADVVPCPTVAGKLTFAWQPEAGGDWYAERRAPAGASQFTKWARLAVIMTDKNIANADEALKRGQAILDSSWWGNRDAFVGETPDKKIFYQCQYMIQDELVGDGNWIALNSFVQDPEQGASARVQANSMMPSAKIGQPTPGILTKLH